MQVVVCQLELVDTGQLADGTFGLYGDSRSRCCPAGQLKRQRTGHTGAAQTQAVFGHLAQLRKFGGGDFIEHFSTPLGCYEVVMTGDVRTVNKALTAVATRVSWFVGGMLLAIFVTWLAIELRMIRRITALTRRAATLSTGIQGVMNGVMSSDKLAAVDLSDLRGNDELGVLAGGLQDLLQRVNEDVRREHVRLAQEKDTWHAVGHEIMSPLQSLMVLHGDSADPAHRYISRMQQAVRVLYGSASPSEAFESSALNVQTLDVNAFLTHVAGNAEAAGIPGVILRPAYCQ